MWNTWAGCIPVHQFMTVGGLLHRRRADHFRGQPVLEHEEGPRRPPSNPWNATTLEWTVPSPPPHDNFGGVHPVVNHGPYEYSVPGAPRDFIMQTDPPGVPSES